YVLVARSLEDLRPGRPSRVRRREAVPGRRRVRRAQALLRGRRPHAQGRLLALDHARRPEDVAVAVRARRRGRGADDGRLEGLEADERHAGLARQDDAERALRDPFRKRVDLPLARRRALPPRGRALIRRILILPLLACPCAPPPAPAFRLAHIPPRPLPPPNESLVILPPSYARSPSNRYPALYFLPDGFGDARSLERRGAAEPPRARMAAGTLRE